jgi:hypothetical protein
MLQHLLAAAPSERKLRLFAIACCRGREQLLDDERSREGLRAARRFADEALGPDEVRAARREAEAAARDHPSPAAWIVRWALDDNPGMAAFQTARHAPAETQARLLHEFFGNPFRPVILNPVWLTPPVLALARGIAEDGAFADLPLLADALEEAGCSDPDLLAHCRQGGEHLPGCWAVDLLCGRGYPRSGGRPRGALP